MVNEKIKRMLDACYQAKRIREMLPPLPEGVMPSALPEAAATTAENTDTEDKTDNEE